MLEAQSVSAWGRARDMAKLCSHRMLQDALDEIARQKPKDLFKPLRVHFIGEDGIDAGKASMPAGGEGQQLLRSALASSSPPFGGLACRRRQEGVLPAAGHGAALPRLWHAHIPAGEWGQQERPLLHMLLDNAHHREPSLLPEPCRAAALLLPLSAWGQVGVANLQLAVLAARRTGVAHLLVQPHHAGGGGRVPAAGAGAGAGHLQRCAARLPAAAGALPQNSGAGGQAARPGGHAAHAGQVRCCVSASQSEKGSSFLGTKALPRPGQPGYLLPRFSMPPTHVLPQVTAAAAAV